MYRRQVLAAGALSLAVASGCLLGDDSSGTDGNDDELLDIADPETLLLTAEQVADVLGDEWHEAHHIDGNETITYSGATTAQTIVPLVDGELEVSRGRVLNGVWLHDDVESSRAAYEDHPDYQPWIEEAGATEVTVGVESVARVVSSIRRGGRWAIVLFRDANGVGAVSYRNSDMDDEELAGVAADLAAKMHSSWRE